MRKGKASIRKLFEIRESVLVLLIIIGAVVMSIISPIFLGISNIKAIFLGLSVEATVAAAMTVLLVSGGLDLSIGSTMALTGVIACMCLKAGIPVVLSIVAGLLTGVLIGFISGTIIAKWKINPFIVTLGMMQIVRGLVLILANGVTIIDLPESFTVIGQGDVLGIQIPIIVTIVIIIIFDVLLRKARFFRQNYYIGGNEKAAVMTGIKVNFVKVTNYMLVGMMAAVAGVMMSARLASASVNIGVGLEMKVITACVIGGASLAGGEGTVVGAFLGSLLMAMMVNALNLLGVDVYWQNVMTGVILIFAVVLDTVLKMRRENAVNMDRQEEMKDAEIA